MGNNFVRPIEPINRLIQADSNLHQKIQQLQAFIHAKQIERFFAKNNILSSGVLGLNTLCKDCSSHMTFVGLLYMGETSQRRFAPRAVISSVRSIFFIWPTKTEIFGLQSSQLKPTKIVGT